MFKNFLPILLKSEGGYSKLAADKGGETYAGITKKNYPTWPGWAIINKLTLSQGEIINDPKLDKLISDFYKKNFWDVLKCDSLTQSVAFNLCDFAINSGVTTAAKAFQQVINSLLPTGATTLITDGKIGNLTVKAANSLDQKKLNEALILYRQNFYKKIVENNPSQAVFLSGWLARLSKFDFVDEIKKKVNIKYIAIAVIAIIAVITVLKIKK